MKNYRFLVSLFLFFQIFACNQIQQGKKKGLLDTLAVNQSDSEPDKMDRVKDTSCINDEKRAIQDINKGKIVYFHFFGMMTTYRSNKEMNLLLSKYNLEVDTVMVSCLRFEGFEQNCYAKKMNEAIDQKYGINFRDSIRIVAEKQFISNHPNLVYYFEECDTVSRYPNTVDYSDFFEKPKKDFFKNFKYPKDYKYKNEEDFSSTEVQFVLFKNGEIGEISVESDFANPKNKKYKNYFESAALDFVKKVKWIPATKLGYKVNSEMSIIFFHK